LEGSGHEEKLGINFQIRKLMRNSIIFNLFEDFPDVLIHVLISGNRLEIQLFLIYSKIFLMS